MENVDATPLFSPDEILTRRIGHNELLAIKVSRTHVNAQREYCAIAEPDGDQLRKYAQHMISSPGRRDDLYWQTAPGTKESPLGPHVARATSVVNSRHHTSYRFETFL